MTLATNKVARITGVIRGLGRSTAIALARGGGDVIITYHAHKNGQAWHDAGFLADARRDSIAPWRHPALQWCVWAAYLAGEWHCGQTALPESTELGAMRLVVVTAGYSRRKHLALLDAPCDAACSLRCRAGGWCGDRRGHRACIFAASASLRRRNFPWNFSVSAYHLAPVGNSARSQGRAGLHANTPW